MGRRDVNETGIIFKLKGNDKSIAAFEQNIYLGGLSFFGQIFNAIQFNNVIEIQYQSFKQSKQSQIILHPYFLKQYNNRWFLFGLNDELKCITNLALDRIKTVNETNRIYIENAKINFNEYFDDVIGVTVLENQEPIPITLQISNNLWPYIRTKPIHGSQKIKLRTDDYVLIELKLQINYELVTLLLSLGEGVKVITPIELVEVIKTKVKSILNNYS